MNLQRTITDLEAKAAQYTEAANSLRALLKLEETGTIRQTAGRVQSTRKAQTNGRRGPSPAAAATGGKKKRTLSAEARAKISAAQKARHQKNKSNAQ